MIKRGFLFFLLCGLNDCRTDVYLDAQAMVVKVEVKYSKFLFSCL